MKPVLKKKPVVIDFAQIALAEVKGLQELKNTLEQIGCECSISASDTVLDPGKLAWVNLRVKYKEKEALVEWGNILGVLEGKKTIFPWEKQGEYRKDFTHPDLGELKHQRFVVYEITKLDKGQLAFVTETIEKWERPTPGPDFGYD